MKKIFRISVAMLVLFAVAQMTFASSTQDYTCIDRVDSKSLPPISSFVDIGKNIEKMSLCPSGKVPKAIIREIIEDNDKAGDIMKYINKSDIENGRTISPEVANCSNGKCYDWVYSIQFADNRGIAAYMTQHNPEIDSTNGIRSRARIHVGGGASSENRVELGWAKERGDITRLYTAWWRHGSWQCDNNDCGGWVQSSNHYYPGMSISTDGYSREYKIQYFDGKWWVYWNGEWLGYYPGDLWNYQFTDADTLMYSGGVTSAVPVTTTDMGNGLWASNQNAARIDSQKYMDLNGYWQIASTMKSLTSVNLYGVFTTSYNGMRYGGPGTSKSVMTVIYPNGGENLVRGTANTILWRYTGWPNTYVGIELLKGGTIHYTITPSTPNDGSFNWQVPLNQKLGNDYKIRIISTDDPKYTTDTSNSSFIISGGNNLPSIRVISPNGGENWARGGAKLITWTKTGNPGTYVKVELLKGGIVNKIIFANTPNDGSQSWTIPSNQALGIDYKIRITSTSNNLYKDISNNNFRIY